MKSFHKASALQNLSSLTAWQPEAFDSAPAEDAPVEWAAILEMFRAAAPQASAEDDGTGGGEAGAAPVRRGAVIWSPEELAREDVFIEDEPFSFMEYQSVSEPEPHSGMFLEDAEQAAAALLQEARTQAEAIVLRGREMADEMIAEAQQEIIAASQEASERGYAEAQEAARHYLQAAQAMLAELEGYKEVILRQAEPLVIDMVKDIALKMFGEGVALENAALQHNLNRVLTNVKSLGDINIYLHPQDAAVLDAEWRAMRSAITGSRIQIFPADMIRRGGCFIEGQMGSVDARVETQLKAVFDSLEEAAGEEELEQ
jgi:flagellar assembly protein FliH